jgi:peptidoglycan/xylan/chitin deacetylase (PgdA/CDA1 family)
MTFFLPAYDTELYDTSGLKEPTAACLEACYKIVEVHRRYRAPATFFIVGKALEANPVEYRELLDDPLFEIASHTYSHRLLRDHPICGPAASLEEIRQEISRGKAVVEEVFQRPCLGLRPGCGFVEGLRGAPEILEIVRQAGFEYVSSMLWGKEYSLPAGLNQAFTYTEDGFPGLWEIPGHGWHENLLKGNNRIWGMEAVRTLLFPPEFPEAIPSRLVKNAQEEFHYNNRYFIDRACREGLGHASLIWHPWSLYRFDPEMEMLELTFEYLREKSIQACTFASYYQILKSKNQGE